MFLLTHLIVRSSFIHPFVLEATDHRDLNSLCEILYSCSAPAKTINNFSFVLPPFTVRHTETWTFSCFVFFKAACLAPACLTVMNETISFHTDVSSIAMSELSLKQNCFCKNQTCIMYLASFSISFSDGSFWAVVVLIYKNIKQVMREVKPKFLDTMHISVEKLGRFCKLLQTISILWKKYKNWKHN